MKKLILRMMVLILTLGGSAHAAWLWDATNDKVNLTDNAILTVPNGDYTLAVWIKPTSRSGSVQRKVLTYNGTGATELSIIIYDPSEATNPDDIGFFVHDNTNQRLLVSTSNPFLNNTSWTSAIVRRASNVYNIYINGASVATVTDSAVTAIDPTTTTLGNSGSGTKPLNGAEAEFAEWNRALTDGEIVSLSKGFSPACMPNSLKVYIPMIRDYVELRVPITVTNGASTAATTVTDHPRIIYCGQ